MTLMHAPLPAYYVRVRDNLIGGHPGNADISWHMFADREEMIEFATAQLSFPQPTGTMREVTAYEIDWGSTDDPGVNPTLPLTNIVSGLIRW